MSTPANAIHVHAFLESTSVLIIVIFVRKASSPVFLRQQLLSVKIHNKSELFNSVAQTAKKGKYHSVEKWDSRDCMYKTG